MKTAISPRIAKFRRLIVAASAQPSDWLEANIRDYNERATALSILACLRILCGRSNSGAVYREKRRAILKSIRTA